jgi:pimeloyl-ACP methyl ester carboxylesterase
LDALYTFEKISSRVWEVVDELKIQKIHLLGVSLGAIIALDMELRHPDRVKSLVLAGAIVRLDNKLKVIANMSLTLAKLIGYRAFYKMAAFIALPRKNHRTSREVFIRESKALSIEEFRKWTKMYRTLNKTLNELFLKATEVPRLLLMGEQDHLFLKPALDYIAKRRNGLVTVIPRCGHVVNIERPQEFNLNCIKFIEDLGL